MTDATTHIFRVSLRAKLYRDIEIPSDRSLYDLAEAIVRAYGFDLDHAFGFFPKLTGNIFDAKPRYELFADMDEGGDSLSVKKTTVAQAFPKVRKTMTFLFDYGDEWRFRVEVLALGERQPRKRYPGVVASVGKAPPQYPDLGDEDWAIYPAAVSLPVNAVARIVLIDGTQLAKLMIRHGVGCGIEEALHIKRVDEDFFE